MDSENTTPAANSKKFNPVLIVVLVVIVLLGGMFWLSMNKNPGASMTQVPSQVTQQPTSSEPGKMSEPNQESEKSKPTTEVKNFQMEMGSFYFKPNTLQVKKGDKVKISFTNAGGIHDFAIDELSVKANRIQTGETTSVEFTADKAGTYEFYCSVGNHRQMGMKGTLVVE
jgi:nitrosocyanin